MDEAAKAVFKFRFQKLLADNPDTIRLLRGKEEANVVNMNTVMEAGPSAVCTFNNYDEALFTHISRCLSEGKQIAINAVGPQNLMVTAAHGLFRKPGERLEQDKVHAVMDALENLRKRYHDDEGRELLTGGLDSWIYPEKYVAMAQKYGFVKHRTFSARDDSLIAEVESFLQRNKMVIVAAWEERAEVYLEPNYPARTEPPPAKTSGCFIATAACGTELAPEVRALSKFRDEILNAYRAGRHFVRIYYAISPVVAALIRRSSMLRLVARVGVVMPAARIARILQRALNNHSG